MPITGTPSSTSDRYATRGDVEAKIGVDNVKSLGDLNGNKDPDEIAARVDEALRITFAKMNGRIRAAGFAIPLVARDVATADVPWDELRSIHADLAAHELMSARDASQPVASEERGDMEDRQKRAMRELRLLILNGLTMATRITSGPSGPVVVTDDSLARRGIVNTWIGTN
jgi:hypothetical protein